MFKGKVGEGGVGVSGRRGGEAVKAEKCLSRAGVACVINMVNNNSVREDLNTVRLKRASKGEAKVREGTVRDIRSSHRR